MASTSRSPGSLTSVQHRVARTSGNQYGIVQVEDFGGEITRDVPRQDLPGVSPGASTSDAIVVIRARESRDDGVNLHAVSMFVPDTGVELGSGPLVISVAEHRGRRPRSITALNDVLIRHRGDNEARLRLVRGSRHECSRSRYLVTDGRPQQCN